MAQERATNLIIRDARINEHDVIQEGTLAAYEEYAKAMPQRAWEGYRQMILTTLDEQGQVERIVAELDGTIVGSVLLYPPDSNTYPGMTAGLSWPEVRLLAVKPVIRGYGIGTALMEECKQRGRRMGATILGLHTTDMMQAAMRMYERMGFVRVPEFDFRPSEKIVVKAYHLHLNPPL